MNQSDRLLVVAGLLEQHSGRAAAPAAAAGDPQRDRLLFEERGSWRRDNSGRIQCNRTGPHSADVFCCRRMAGSVLKTPRAVQGRPSRLWSIDQGQRFCTAWTLFIGARPSAQARDR